MSLFSAVNNLESLFKYNSLFTKQYHRYKAKGGVLSWIDFIIVFFNLKRELSDWNLFYRMQGIESSLVMNGYNAYYATYQIPETVKMLSALILDYLFSDFPVNKILFDSKKRYRSSLKIIYEQEKNYSFSKKGIEALLTEAFALSPLEKSFREHYDSFISE